MPNADIIREWLTSLGILTAVSVSRQEAETKLAAFVPMLASRFPGAAFTPASLEFVAAHCPKGFPTYSELATPLGQWWRDNRPPLPRLAAPRQPDRKAPTQEQCDYVRARVQEFIANCHNYGHQANERPQPRHLTPEQLDQLNPLPGGRKRASSSP